MNQSKPVRARRDGKARTARAPAAVLCLILGSMIGAACSSSPSPEGAAPVAAGQDASDHSVDASSADTAMPGCQPTPQDAGLVCETPATALVYTVGAAGGNPCSSFTCALDGHCCDPGTQACFPSTPYNVCVPQGLRRCGATDTACPTAMDCTADGACCPKGATCSKCAATPTVGTWSSMSTMNMPRGGDSVVWTGKLLIHWGPTDPFGGAGGVPSNRAAYDPQTDTWKALAVASTPIPGGTAAMVWTGSEVIVWQVNSDPPAGGRYNPATDTWRGMSQVGAPMPSSVASDTVWAWTGTEMITVGRGGPRVAGRYNPTTDTWGQIDAGDIVFPDGGSAPLDRQALWTGTELLTAATRYDPTKNSWRLVSQVGIPDYDSGGGGPRAALAGGKMYLSGRDPSNPRNTVASVYDPALNTWERLPPDGTTGSSNYASLPRTLISTGQQIIEFGGDSASGLYDIATRSWLRLAKSKMPTVYGHSAVWTGKEMLVWYGAGQPCPACSPIPAFGLRYTPPPPLPPPCP